MRFECDFRQPATRVLEKEVELGVLPELHAAVVAGRSSAGQKLLPWTLLPELP